MPEATIAEPSSSPVALAEPATALPAWRKTGTYTLPLLRQVDSADQPWIINNLIREGEQVVLSGPPKSGKTILGLQLALAVASEATEANWFLLPQHTVPKQPATAPKKPVLFLSFEMKQRAMLRRLILQLPKGAEPDIQFQFGIPGKDSFTLFTYGEGNRIEQTKDGETLQAIIRACAPRLIVIDSLIQLHGLDENNNGAMSAVMRLIRRLCSTVHEVTEKDYHEDMANEIEMQPAQKATETTEATPARYWKRTPIAHVIIHHNRKSSDPTKNFATPDAIRGAGAIHSEADLAITLATRGRFIALNKSARNLSAEDVLTFGIKDKPLSFEQKIQTNIGKLDLLAKTFHGLKRAELVEAKDVEEVMRGQKEFKFFSNGGGDAFYKGFVKKIQHLNDAPKRSGPGNSKRILLRPNTLMLDFLHLFVKEDIEDPNRLGELPPLVFRTVEEKPAPAASEGKKKKKASKKKEDI